MAGSTIFAAGSSPLTRGKLEIPHQGLAARGLIPAHAGKTPQPGLMAPTIRAHPRSRGENRLLGGSCYCASGSSPLTRGKPASWGVMLLRLRLIPAHAGKTRLMSAGMIQARAHPRSRGENIADSAPDRSSRGSSPLTRGKRPTCRCCQATHRLIPAHAGKTSPYSSKRFRCGAHPRSRGENSTLQAWFSRVTGSSPLTRGKPF